VHLAAMRRALEATPPGPAPELEAIAARLGGFSSPSDGVGSEPPARDRRRRRG
jgi:5-methyltetrahydrofolate--homocysteine methyltransferase